MATLLEKQDPYKSLGLLATGGQGKVYKVECRTTRKVFARKTIKNFVGLDAKEKELIQHEVAVMEKVRHPFLIHYKEHYIRGQDLNIILGFIEGKTLDKIMREGKIEKFSLFDLIEILCDVLSALDALHIHGYIHRDLKPENILIARKMVNGARRWCGFLIDLGISCTPETSKLPNGEILGTPYYMSPEQALSKKLSYRSDLFSFGIIVYEIFTQERPFEYNGIIDILHAIIHCNYQDPAELYVMPELSEIINYLLKKDVAHRFQTAEDVIRLLRQIAKKFKP